MGIPPPSFGDTGWWTPALAGMAAIGSLVASLAALRALYYFKGHKDLGLPQVTVATP
jgi:hypothetical protein